MVTDEELKALVAENSLAIRELRADRKESERRWQESRAESERRWQESQEESEHRRAESERRWAESERRWQESHEESEHRRAESERRWAESERRWGESERRWKESHAESERRWQESRQETDRIWQEIRASRQEWREDSERLWQEVRASREESDRLLTSFNRQLGELGNRLGDYTESLFRPSLDRALRERFGMKVITSPQRVWENGDYYEFDMVGHAGNQSDEVYLVEIKSKLRDDSIEQLVGQLRRFPRLFPEHRGKKLYGILAALEIPAELRHRVLREGFYLASIKDDVFEIVPPGDGFKPQAFGLRGLS
jgi:hypothetical protein